MSAPTVVDYELAITKLLRSKLAPITVVNVVQAIRANEVGAVVLPYVALQVVTASALAGQWRLAQVVTVAITTVEDTRAKARALALRVYAELHYAAEMGHRVAEGSVSSLTDLISPVELETADPSGHSAFVATYSLIVRP